MVSCRFRKCLCGIPLKAATIIIGVLCITFSLIGLYALIILREKSSYENTGLSKSCLKTFGYVTLLGSLTVGIAYIIGAVKGHRKLILFGLLIHFAVAVIDGLIFLVATATRSKYDDVIKDSSKNSKYQVFNILFGISLLTIFGAYFLLIINSFRLQLESSDLQPLHIEKSEPSSKPKIPKTSSQSTHDTCETIPGDKPQGDLKQATTSKPNYNEKGSPGDIEPFSPLFMNVSSENNKESPRIAERISSRQSTLTQTSSTSIFSTRL